MQNLKTIENQNDTEDLNSINHEMLYTIYNALGHIQKNTLNLWALGMKNNQLSKITGLSVKDIISIKLSIRDTAQNLYPDAVINFEFGIYF